MNAPKISVIVPVYNVEKYLQRCIESILSQTFTDFEVLLIDDGSNDRSGEICDEYAKKDGRIRVFHKENGGVSSARNTGLDNVQGEWVCFVDSDDWLDLDFLMLVLQDSAKADIIFYGCKLQYIDQTTTVYLPFEIFTANRCEIEHYLYRLKCNPQQFEYLGYTWNKIFKTSIIREIGIRFVTDLSIREDEVFTLSYCKFAKSLKIRSISPYNYRILYNGLTFSQKKSCEYTLLVNQLIDLIRSYQDVDFLDAEHNAILVHMFSSIRFEKILRKKWRKNMKEMFSYYDNHSKFISKITDKKVALILFKKNFMFRFCMVLMLCLGYKILNGRK